jgi:hypothetical protein
MTDTIDLNAALEAYRADPDGDWVLARMTRRLGRPAGPVIGVLLPRWSVGRNGAFDPNRPPQVTPP